jgi:protein-disulfide isomerase
MRRALPFVIIGAVLLIAAGGGFLLFRAKNAITPLQIKAGQPGAEPAHVRGAANARVTLEEFGDLQCPPCGILATTLLKLEHDYGTKIRVVFREFPLAMHAHAMTAACAAEAAGLQGRFWEMHDLLFEHAMHWSKEGSNPSSPVTPLTLPNPSTDEKTAQVRAIFEDYASRLKLDVERFKKDMDSEPVKARIKADQERGASIGVDRTPILFIEGVQIPFASFNEATLHTIIDAALKGQTPAPLPPSPPPQPK